MLTGGRSWLTDVTGPPGLSLLTWLSERPLEGFLRRPNRNCIRIQPQGSAAEWSLSGEERGKVLAPQESSLWKSTDCLVLEVLCGPHRVSQRVHLLAQWFQSCGFSTSSNQASREVIGNADFCFHLKWTEFEILV